MKSLPQRVSGAIMRSPAIAALLAVAFFAMLAAMTPPLSAKEARANKPTVVLVHGAFAESSSWNATTSRLHAKGYRVVAVANPLPVSGATRTTL